MKDPKEKDVQTTDETKDQTATIDVKHDDRVWDEWHDIGGEG